MKSYLSTILNYLFLFFFQKRKIGFSSKTVKSHVYAKTTKSQNCKIMFFLQDKPSAWVFIKKKKDEPSAWRNQQYSTLIWINHLAKTFGWGWKEQTTSYCFTWSIWMEHLDEKAIWRNEHCINFFFFFFFWPKTFLINAGKRKKLQALRL